MSDYLDPNNEELLKDFDDEGATVAVKVFNSDLSNNERKKISKSVQFSLYCADVLEVVAKSDEADYICTGKIEVDGPNYIISAKLVDNYDDKVIGKAKQKVPKDYYAEKSTDVKVETVVVEVVFTILVDVFVIVLVPSVIVTSAVAPAGTITFPEPSFSAPWR